MIHQFEKSSRVSKNSVIGFIEEGYLFEENNYEFPKKKVKKDREKSKRKRKIPA